jgi:hypothetical protein
LSDKKAHVQSISRRTITGIEPTALTFAFLSPAKVATTPRLRRLALGLSEKLYKSIAHKPKY